MNRTAFFLIVGGGILIVILMGRKLVSPTLESMARAIMDFEGYFQGSASQRNNNPGNLKFAGQTGAVGRDNQGHAIFNTFEDGWNALINQLKIAFTGHSTIYSPTDTLRSFFSKYAEANSEPYAKFVADRLGVTPDTRLIDIA